MLTLLLGGARSGKSALAERLAAASGQPVSVIATARAEDADMRARITRHQADRPAVWSTIEEPISLISAIESVAPDVCVIVDCLTLWTSNLLLAGSPIPEIEAASRSTAALAAARPGATIVVSNEVGLGIHPTSELGMVYRDLHGRCNRDWAGAADRAFLVVAGHVLRLESACDLMPELRESRV